MRFSSHHSSRGFTLIELAIVLGIAGLLFTGLWRLLASSNSQMRDQAASSQQSQLLGAVSNYLQSTEGQAFMAAIDPTNVTTKNPTALLLPSVIGNAAGTPGCSGAPGPDPNMIAAGGMPTHTGLCGFLPPGFYAGTTNSYGQTFAIEILKDQTPVGTAPQSYSFLILTQNGDVISDTSGGRISALLGGDGGFVYNTDVCTTPGNNAKVACGAYGSWQTQISTYFGVTLAAGGHIASRTFYTPTQATNSLWLARYTVAGDSATSPEYNMMHSPANLFLGGEVMYFGCDNTAGNLEGNCLGPPLKVGSLYAQGGSINMGDAAGAVAGGSINMQGGNITMFNAPAANGTVNGSIILNGGSVTDGSSNGLVLSLINNNALTFIAEGNPKAKIVSGCTKDSGIVNIAIPQFSAVCPPALDIEGDQSVGGRLTANSLYAQTFIYQGSDVRLKHNIRLLKTPLDDIMQLKPVSFDFNVSNKSSLGVIAQDIEKVYPQLVSVRADGMKAVNYDGLIAPLIGAIQELKLENEQLKSQLHDQALKQQAMEKRLNSN